MKFKCQYKLEDSIEEWTGEIMDYHAYGTHFELTAPAVPT